LIATLGVGELGNAFGVPQKQPDISPATLLYTPLEQLQPLPVPVDAPMDHHHAFFCHQHHHQHQHHHASPTHTVTGADGSNKETFSGEIFPLASSSEPVQHQTLSFLQPGGAPIVVPDHAFAQHTADAAVEAQAHGQQYATKDAKAPTKVTKSTRGRKPKADMDILARKVKRRFSHNAVERRRRDNINDRIVELQHLLVGEHYLFGHIDERSGKASTSGPSKAETLYKAIMHLRFHQHKETLLRNAMREQRTVIDKLRAELNKQNPDTKKQNSDIVKDIDMHLVDLDNEAKAVAEREHLQSEAQKEAHYAALSSSTQSPALSPHP